MAVFPSVPYKFPLPGGEGWGEGINLTLSPHPRLWLPASPYLLLPCSRNLLPRGEGTHCLDISRFDNYVVVMNALFSNIILLSNNIYSAAARLSLIET